MEKSKAENASLRTALLPVYRLATHGAHSYGNSDTRRRALQMLIDFGRAQKLPEPEIPKGDSR
jgi:hypothetical protein